jgi:hypothetical protein
MEIINTSTQLQFVFTSAPSRTRTVSKRKIQSIDKKRDGLSLVINIDHSEGERDYVVVKFSELTSPVCADIDALETLLWSYVNQSVAVTRSGQVAITTGANTITFTAPMPTLDYTVVYNDVYGVGVDAPSNLTLTGFDLNNALGNGIVTYIATLN